LYWPKLHGTKRFDAILVFSEIMGVIKGGASFATGHRAMTREEYFALSPNLAPTFPSTLDREAVYKMFEEYEQRKSQFGHHDSIDKLLVVIRHFTESNFRKSIEGLVDEIYVD